LDVGSDHGRHTLTNTFVLKKLQFGNQRRG
jgi:hypothetical protein